MKVADKKVAVVTGGAMGIGAEAAISLARDGHHVVICDINAQEAERFSRQLRDEGLLPMRAGWMLAIPLLFRKPLPGSRTSLVAAMCW